jgi:hypothetical protein
MRQSCANFCRAQQLHKRLDDGVGAHFHVAVDHAGVRIKNRNARIQQFAALRQPQPRIEHHHFRTRVAAEHFAGIVGLDRDYFLVRPVKHSRHIGEVVLAVRIGGGKTVDMLIQSGHIESIEARS